MTCDVRNLHAQCDFMFYRFPPIKNDFPTHALNSNPYYENI